MFGRIVLCVVLGGMTALAADDPAKPAQDQAEKDLAARSITLKDPAIPLSKALAELAKQTGNTVEDRRQNRENATLKLDLQKASFWQTLDTIARQADLRVSLFEQDGKIALVDGPHKVVPVSYDGIFRCTVRKLTLVQMVEEDNHTMQVELEVAWEPRFRPLMIQAQPDDLVVRDDKGRDLSAADMGQGMIPVSKRLSTNVTLRIDAPQRSAKNLAHVKGKLNLIGPGKMIEFAFDKLAPITKKAEQRKVTNDNVTLNLRQMRTEGAEGDAIWTVDLLLEYPESGPKFESFQSFIVNNEIHLEKEKDGIKQRFPSNFGYETEDQTENKALVRYRFGDDPDKKLMLGKMADWKLVYRAPGKMTTIPVVFEFKGVDLP